MTVAPTSVGKYDVAIVGAGIAGIATAYYLAKAAPRVKLLLIDSGQPMGFTSAQSGENYRNWWPHPAMVALSNRSIDLLEQIAAATGNATNMTRRGYLLATREKNIDPLIAQLHNGLGDRAESLLRFHEDRNLSFYTPLPGLDWKSAPDGVDIILDQSLIRKSYPTLNASVQRLIHIRRGGDIDSYQLGMVMLSQLRDQGTARLTAAVTGISSAGCFTLTTQNPDGPATVQAEKIINAAGPFADNIAQMLDISLPIKNTLQQKIAFDDRSGAIPRTLPFTIDLDGQTIDWSDEERDMLAASADHQWLTRAMPGAIHCRPDGGPNGTRIRLGWAYNQSLQIPDRDPQLDDSFPEIVLRGAARLHPGLKAYYGCLPRPLHHYGGWYTMTEENWPLIGPMGPNGAYMICALSGFGTMAACAAGELCAAWALDLPRPSYATGFSLDRYGNPALMAQLHHANKGIL